MFLSDEDVISLTGYVKKSLMCRWLARNGFRFWVRADGMPVVPAFQLERNATARHRTSWEPDLSAFDRKR